MSHDEVDIEKLTFEELKEFCKSFDVKTYSRHIKTDLIEFIKKLTVKKLKELCKCFKIENYSKHDKEALIGGLIIKIIFEERTDPENPSVKRYCNTLIENPSVKRDCNTTIADEECPFCGASNCCCGSGY
jgi:hypothetical protein